MAKFSVVYSIKAKIAGPGIGTTSYHAARGIYKANNLTKLLCASFSPNEIDKNLIRTIPVDFFDHLRGIRQIYPYWLEDSLYDFLVSLIVPKSDIFHVWNNHGLSSLRKAKKQGALTVVERASSHILEQKRLLEEEYKRFGLKANPIHPVILKRCLQELEETDYVTVPSDFAYESFLNRGFKKEKLIKLSFGTDLDKYKPQKRNDDIFRVLFVGEVGLRKGVIYLLEAWQKLALKNAQLVLVGREPDECRHLFTKYKNLANVKFTGFSNPLPWYQNSSVFVFPSLEEGSALVTYEALASGLSVITTYNSGTCVQDNIDGYVVPIKDSNAIAEKIEFLYKNPEIREKMSRQAAIKAQDYSWESYGKNLVNAYEKILH